MISGAIGSDVRDTLAIGADRHLMPSSNETSADRPMVVKRTPRRAARRWRCEIHDGRRDCADHSTITPRDRERRRRCDV